MAAARKSIRYGARLGMGAIFGAALLPLCGCATGSSASFTQAPLLFAEQTDPMGTASDPATSDQTSMRSDPQVAAEGGQGKFISIGSNASLPTAAVTSITHPVGTAIAQVATTAPVSLRIAPGTAAVTAGLPALAVAAQVGVSKGSLDVDLQAGVLPPINVEADLPKVVGGATAIVTQLVSSTPIVSSVLSKAPVAGLGNAVDGTVAAVGSTTAAILQPVQATITGPLALIASKPPIIPSPIAPAGIAQSVAVTGNSLLATSAGTLARICLLKGCR